jgi:hypothetical protein
MKPSSTNDDMILRSVVLPEPPGIDDADDFPTLS